MQIELKIRKKLFFFAHILHVLHLPRYTLNKILSVNCALLELLCKKIYFTPPFVITSLGTTLPKNSNMSRIILHCAIATHLNFMNYFLPHFIYYCCHKFLFLESSSIPTYTYVKYSISWHQHKPSWMVKLCIQHNCYATIITYFTGHQPTWSLSLVMLPWPVPPL